MWRSYSCICRKWPPGTKYLKFREASDFSRAQLLLSYWIWGHSSRGKWVRRLLRPLDWLLPRLHQQWEAHRVPISSPGLFQPCGWGNLHTVIYTFATGTVGTGTWAFGLCMVEETMMFLIICSKVSILVLFLHFFLVCIGYIKVDFIMILPYTGGIPFGHIYLHCHQWWFEWK